jgi:hypothetical protein
MKLSRVLAITLLGAIAMTNTAVAKGTAAGTKITNTPMLSYSMGGEKKTLKAPVSSYVVDKVINFTLKRDTATEQKIQVGALAYAPYTLTNIGNSKENFVVRGNQSHVKGFKFTKTMVFVDKNGNGNLDKNEKVATSLVKGLKANKKTKVWIAVQTSTNTAIGKRNAYGIEVRATPKGVKEIYTKQTVKNSMAKMDIVFADGTYKASADKVRDNRLILWYGWNTVAVDGKLTTKLSWSRVSADPINGVCKDSKDAATGKYKAIPGATVIKSWYVQNLTKETAKNVKISMKINSKLEKVAKDSKKTWWKNDKRVHLIMNKVNGKWKTVGEGKYNSKTKAIDFVIKEMKPNSTYHLRIVTELK